MWEEKKVVRTFQKKVSLNWIAAKPGCVHGPQLLWAPVTFSCYRQVLGACFKKQIFVWNASHGMYSSELLHGFRITIAHRKVTYASERKKKKKQYLWNTIIFCPRIKLCWSSMQRENWKVLGFFIAT